MHTVGNLYIVMVSSMPWMEQYQYSDLDHSTVCSNASKRLKQRSYQSSALLAFVLEMHYTQGQ